MGEHCCNHEIKFNETNKAFKRVLWIALVLNLGMFFVEVIYGVISGSISLRADAIDFLGDSANYFLTLFFIHSILSVKAKVSMTKAICMLIFGIWVLIEAGFRFFSTRVPDPVSMSWIGLFALVANIVVAILLYKFREGDSNMQSVWLCSRNDAIGNLAVILASGGVYLFTSRWPDLVVAALMAGLAIHSAFQIIGTARKELTHSH